MHNLDQIMCKLWDLCIKTNFINCSDSLNDIVLIIILVMYSLVFNINPGYLPNLA